MYVCMYVFAFVRVCACVYAFAYSNVRMQMYENVFNCMKLHTWISFARENLFAPQHDLYELTFIPVLECLEMNRVAHFEKKVRERELKESEKKKALTLVSCSIRAERPFSILFGICTFPYVKEVVYFLNYSFVSSNRFYESMII